MDKSFFLLHKCVSLLIFTFYSHFVTSIRSEWRHCALKSSIERIAVVALMSPQRWDKKLRQPSHSLLLFFHPTLRHMVWVMRPIFIIRVPPPPPSSPSYSHPARFFLSASAHRRRLRNRRKLSRRQGRGGAGHHSKVAL